ncbi:hypothetical protein IFM89_029244 [Coptis chinensis]|uniref:Uncharacterized protein n=1 Tax=Coptis chinensis TaxID=261450 RepID=A0A835GZQ7_9MAGN|nr:hypothetical protein IFM89_029244 [Coptis chinensis]
MVLKLDVISKETIKPSSPTPHHLRTFKLSGIDQFAPPIPLPIIIFYSLNDYDKVENDMRTDRLKKSLSEMLTHFYHLGGRIVDNQVINCNDEGVNFFEARVNGHLSDTLNNPISEELDLLLPKDITFINGWDRKGLLSVQVNNFDCGGMALGVCLSHKAGDTSSLGLFLNNWAALTREDNDGILRPELDLTSVFPPRDVTSYVHTSTGSPPQKVINKRLAALKAKSSNELYVEYPTRVEAVSALIWRCAMKFVRMRTRSVESVTVANHAVNLRWRMVPPLSNLFFGNLVSGAMATLRTESPPELHCLVSQMREAVSKVNGEFVRNLRGDGLSAYWNHLKEANERQVKGVLELFMFTSWCRFPFYEADFGWGKPIWISTVNWRFKNSFILMDTKCGDGVEAWISLDEEDMARFECDLELIAFTSAENI